MIGPKKNFKYQDEPIFFPSTIQVPVHGKFKTKKLIACLYPQYRILIQCQNIVYVLNEHEIVPPKLRMLKGLTDGNDYDINDTQSKIGELIHEETDAIVLYESASKLEQSNQMLGIKQIEDVTQTKVQTELSPHSLRKIKCSPCKNYIYI